jgi:Ca-activated chloride channel family protein
MNFCSPEQGWWGLAAVLLALLYLIRLGGKNYDVSAYEIWQEALARRGAWRRWQRYVSLLLAISLLAVLVLALCDPCFTRRAEEARHIVVIVDTSASMYAADVEPDRFARSLAQARQAVGAVKMFEQMAILSAGETVGVLRGMTGDRDQLYAALESLTPTNARAQLNQAVETAQKLLADKPNGKIFVFTDAAHPEAVAISELDNVEVVTQGGPTANAAVTKLVARPRLDNPTRLEVMVEVANFGPERVEREVRVGVNGAEETKLIFDLSAAEGGDPRSESQSFTMDTAAGGLLVAQLTGEDAIAADDRLHAIVPKRQPREIVFVGPEDSEVLAILRAMPGIRVVNGTVGPDVAAPDVDEPVFVFHRLSEEHPATCNCLGPYLFVEPLFHAYETFDMEKEAGETVSVRAPMQQKPESAVLAGIDLSTVVIEEAIPLQFKDPTETLVAATSGEPILTYIPRVGYTKHPAYVLHTRTGKTDLPLRREFPLLITNLVRDLAGVQAELYCARNPTERGESDVTPRKIAAADVDFVADRRDRGRPIRVYLLGMAIILFVAEWFSFQRGATV